MTVRLDRKVENSADIPLFENIADALGAMFSARRCRICGSSEYLVSMRSEPTPETPTIPYFGIFGSGIGGWPVRVSVVILVSCEECGLIDIFDARALARHLAKVS